MPSHPDFYDVLDVSPDADAETIRAAYREQAKETHPDVSDHPEAEARFKRVTRAKAVLTDPEERARYDRLGHARYVETADGFAVDSGAEDDADAADEAAATDSDSGGGETATDERASAGGETTTGDTADTANAAESASGGSAAWDQSGTRPGGASATTAGGYATRTEYTEQSFDRIRVPLTPGSIIQIGTMVFLYPVFLFASLAPAFPLTVNLVVGLCTILVVGYLLSIPEVGMVVFGGWGVLAPAVLVALDGVGVVSLLGVIALTACWIPFGLSVLTRMALRT
ncbi:J domain-containing protein [Halorientalis halophila]|uniref:J domain-containing protein n=1 Tax=Halorientalis halophila TaxID=3108499 RepID=UPI00300AFB2E